MTDGGSSGRETVKKSVTVTKATEKWMDEAYPDAINFADQVRQMAAELRIYRRTLGLDDAALVRIDEQDDADE